jgi:multidrug resistance efflux pump
MIALLLVYTAFLTFVIVYGIHHYEAKIKDHKASIDDYRRALSLSKHHSNTEHYTQLQLDNASMRKSLSDLDTANYLLQEQVRQLKVSLAESRPLQYESSRYEHPVYANQQELEIDSLFERQIDFE